MPTIEDFKRLHAVGWNAIPAPLKSKAPVGSWRRFQTDRITEREIRVANAEEETNAFVVTGSVSRLAVLDCDNDEAIAYWAERLGADVMAATTQAITGRGRHYYWSLPQGRVERGRSSADEKVKWDIRAEGQGVIVPPSVHPSGRLYRWADERGPEALRPAPRELWRREDDAGAKEADKGPRSLLTTLLNRPPGEGRRNNWLAQVAGHYASYLPGHDAYELHVRQAAERLEPPLPEEEIAKLVDSIWRAEQSKKGRMAPPGGTDEDEATAWWKNLVEPTEENGWLVSGRTRILCQTRERRGRGEYEFVLKPWMDADLRVLGVIGQGDDRAYEVELLRTDLRAESALPAATVADPRALARWLAGYGVSIAPPDDIWPIRMSANARLLRYMEAQDAVAMEAVEALGWHDPSTAFITHEGVIRAEGPGPHESVRPQPTLVNWAPYRYGHRDKAEAADVLAEVLTFHDQAVAAVFGAWWAATLLKPQIHRYSSQFPFMALEATSESGKTTGYFSLMLQLSGGQSGSSATTRAAFRDALSAHRSGIVWLDDLDTLEHHMELLRQVTVEGSLVKKGTDHQSQVVAALRAALVVSGENLGLRDQKALLDRAILLDVPSPVGRRSLKGDWPQWEDILALRDKYPDLTDFAGSVVELALAQAELVKGIKVLREGAGRFADKGAVLRLGARVLQGILGEGSEIAEQRGVEVVEEVDRWVAGTEDLGQENTLTLKAVPAALSRTGWLKYPAAPDPVRRRVATPAWVDPDHENVVWFSPKLLAQWLRDTYGRVGARVESEEALVQQARALGLGGTRERFKLRDEWGRVGDSNLRHYYWRIDGDLAGHVLERSRGGE